MATRLKRALEINLLRSAHDRESVHRLGRELNTPTDTVLLRWSNAVPAKAADAADVWHLRERLTEAIKEANRSHGKATVDQKAAYDRAHADVVQQVGDTVLKFNQTQSKSRTVFAAGLAPRWFRPFVVAERISRLKYKLKAPKPGRISGPIHVDDLKQSFRGKKLRTLPMRVPKIPNSREVRKQGFRRTATTRAIREFVSRWVTVSG